MKSDRFINAQRALHADMLAALSEGRAEIVYDSETALVLREKNCGVYFLTAKESAEAETLLRQLYEKDATVVLHGELLPGLSAKIGFEIDPPCRQVMYEGTPLPVEGELALRHPDSADFETVAQNYSLTGGDALRRDFDKPEFLGGYLGNRLVCFCGLHCEGSMGLLTVLPDCRRRGFAQQIYSQLINDQLAKGRIPYAQIYADNENSLRLQKKLGFTFSEEFIRWSWRP